MEENEKGGYSAEGRKLRPRRQRVSSENEGSYGYSENRNYDHSEGRSYSSDYHKSYGSSEGGYQRRNGSEGGYQHRGYSEGGYQRRNNSEGGYQHRNNSEGGYQRRNNPEGGYQHRGDSGNEGYRQKSYGSREGGERRSYGSRDGGSSYSNKGYGSHSGSSDRRGSSSYGERKPYNKGGYNKGGYSSSDNRKGGYSSSEGKGGYRKGSTGRSTGFVSKYQFDDSAEGINRMLSRKAVIDQNQASDFESAPTEIQEEIRLNKFIANSGVCSRREADQFILAGVVTVNGEVVTELGSKVNVLNDEVKFNGETIRGEKKVYIVMNKPKGFVTTSSDPHADKTVMDLLKGCTSRVFPVGRLDKNTTGVLMFTNDGDIAEKLTHPSFDKKKIYQVILDNPLSDEHKEQILSGITLNDGDVKADELEYIDETDKRKVGIEIHSGKNRIVRRIFESLGYDVKALDRVYFAGLTKKGLNKGEWRYLTDGEANLLKMGAYL